jgi:hypothetical protein
MFFALPFDVSLLTPVSLLIDKFLLDFDVLDVMVWYPRLSWIELGRALGAVLACKVAGDQVERWALAPIKSRVKRKLGCWCARTWPGLSRRLGHGAPAEHKLSP